MEVVILAAGQGTRLRPLTHDRPKGLLLVAGRPILQHLLDNLAKLGVKDATIVVGHGHERLRAFLGDGTAFGLKLRYVEQARQLGPGHALHQAAGQLKGERILMLPADAWYDLDLLGQLVKAKEPTLVAVPDDRSARHGVPTLRNNQAVALEESAAPDSIASGGAYVLPRRILDGLEATAFRLPAAVREDLKRNGPWQVLKAKAGQYADIIEPEDLLALHERLMAGIKGRIAGTVEPGAHISGAVILEEDSIIRAGSVVQGPVHIGKSCDVGPHAVLGPGTALRNHVRVEPFTYLTACTVSSNVVIGSHARLNRVIVDNGAQIGSGVSIPGPAASVVGADAALEPGSTVAPGGVIGRGAKVSAGRSVLSVPDQGVAV